MISQLLEILGDAHDQRHVQTGFVGIPFSTRKHSSMIPEVENESILEESILLEFFQNRPHLSVHHGHAVKIPGMGVTEGRSIRMIRVKLHSVDRRFRLFRLHELGGKMQGTLMASAKGLHVEKRRVLVRTLAPRGFP